MVADNFAKAVTGAITETRRQWQDFQAELTARYGAKEAALMTCALTHDDPVDDCGTFGWGWLVAGIVLIAVALAVAIWFIRHRKRSATGAERIVPSR